MTMVDARVMVINGHPNVLGALSRLHSPHDVPGLLGRPVGLYNYALSLEPIALLKFGTFGYGIEPGPFEMPQSFDQNCTYARFCHFQRSEVWPLDSSLHALEAFESFLMASAMGACCQEQAYQREITRLKDELQFSRQPRRWYNKHGLSLRTFAAVLRICALSGELGMLSMKFIA